MPVLFADALPPLSVCTTTRGTAARGACTERTAPRVGTSPGTTRGTSTRSKCCCSTSNVRSEEPSTTTTTSKRGCCSESIVRTLSTIVFSSSYAGITTDTPRVSGSA
jgi:hypothetical protein